MALGLSSCSTPSPSVIEAAMAGDAERLLRTVIEEELERQGVPADLEGIPEVIELLIDRLSVLWGEAEPEVASEHRYVKYSNAYEARAIVDFDEGWLQVETIATEDPLAKLREAIVATLLTTRDMRVEDVFSDAAPDTDGEPFLYEQVLDADGQAIRWRWRAERFADYLLANALVLRQQGARTLRSVRVDLVDDHLHLRELEYADYVLAASRRYGIEAPLVYAVIEVESAFNPYAVSPASAYGLMQVVPATAGRDVYERVKKRSGQPTRDQLFEPDFNIDIGSAYLHLLEDVYLQRIGNSRSRAYAAIASYNGGVGTLLRSFDRDAARAIDRINALSPEQVYASITREHPFAETRRYLEKVTAAERRYR
ncbi:MAG: murein transglycosylase domain-containing protein [Halieaceae bacterium]|nr:murein transglycosylase domain-containing protein [Halieaceae bacterium]